MASEVAEAAAGGRGWAPRCAPPGGPPPAREPRGRPSWRSLRPPSPWQDLADIARRTIGCHSTQGTSVLI
jgi:hypothetical protein